MGAARVWGKWVGQLLFNGYKVSVIQDEKVLEVCYRTIQLTILYSTHKQFIKRADFTLCFTTIEKKGKKKVMFLNPCQLPPGSHTSMAFLQGLPKEAHQ